MSFKTCRFNKTTAYSTNGKLLSASGNTLFFILATIGCSSAENIWSDSLANECSTPKPEWIWCDDFEIDRSSDYFEGSVDRVDSLGVADSTAGAFHFIAGNSGAGDIKVAFGRTPGNPFLPVDNGNADYREVYWRMFVTVPLNWVGNGADKLSRATIIADSSWSQAMIAHVWSGTDPGNYSEVLYLDPASGTDSNGNVVTSGYNDFNNLQWLGADSSSFQVFAEENFGQWHCIEAHTKLNDAGFSNGEFSLTINNQLEVQITGLDWVSSYDDYGINAIFFENWWNNGSPVDQTRYFDNLVISTQVIGCGDEISPPAAPTNVIIELGG